MQSFMDLSVIYESALALLGEMPGQGDEFHPNVIALINTLIADCFDVNNTLRVYRGEKALEEIPFNESLDDRLEYEEQLCRDMLPYGLAALMILEDDANRAGFFDFRYQQKKLHYSKMENVEPECEADGLL